MGVKHKKELTALQFKFLRVKITRSFICISPNLIGPGPQSKICSKTHVKMILFKYEEFYIKMYHKCVGGIEKSVTRITVWHHEACQVITNGDPYG